jgi:DNA-binding transcriptional LysR family regulator
LELRQLAALVSVAQSGSFTRAAEELSLTQSAVTRQIAALEKETRTKLLDRLGRGVVPTPAGLVLQRYAVEILRLDSEALHALEDVRSGAGGRLAVGSSSTAAAYLLPQLLRDFRRDRPGVDLSVLTGPSRRVAEMVASNEVDIGLLMDEPVIGGLHLTKVADYSIALIVHAGHPLTRKNQKASRFVELSELTQLPLILMQKGASLRRSVDELLEHSGPAHQIAMELDNVEAIKKMIEADLGVSLLPIMSVKNEIASGTLVALPINDSMAPRPSIILIRRTDKYISGAMSAFIDLIRSKLPTIVD